MRLLKIAFLLGGLSFGSAGLPLEAEYVQTVIDGDTVILGNQQRVRLIGIDSPEIDHPKYGRFGEYFGEESRTYLKELIEGRDVRLEDGDEAFDKYGRRLAYVFADDLLVNREMVRLGYAEVFRAFDFRYKEEFLALEREAKAAGRGMWNPERRSALDEVPREKKTNSRFPFFVFGLIFAGIYFFLRRRRTRRF